jgi:hypothetical protein
MWPGLFHSCPINREGALTTMLLCSFCCFTYPGSFSKLCTQRLCETYVHRENKAFNLHTLSSFDPVAFTNNNAIIYIKVYIMVLYNKRLCPVIHIYTYIADPHKKGTMAIHQMTISGTTKSQTTISQKPIKRRYIERR